MSSIDLPDDDGYSSTLFNIDMPLGLRNRSFISTYYRYEKQDGTKVVLSSTLGNEHLWEENADIVEDNIEFIEYITQVSYKPYDGGIEFEYVTHGDPQVLWVPKFIQRKAEDFMARSLIHTVEYV